MDNDCKLGTSKAEQLLGVESWKRKKVLRAILGKNVPPALKFAFF